MNLIKALFLALFISVFSMQLSTAQSDFGLEEYGMPTSNFPTPPNAEIASSVVNFNLDYAGLNPGRNLLHIDNATEIKLFVFRVNTDYYLYAEDKAGKYVDVVIEKAKENRGCLFATIDRTWVNVLCSDQLRYTTKMKDKVFAALEEMKKKEAEAAKKAAAKKANSPLPIKDK